MFKFNDNLMCSSAFTASKYCYRQAQNESGRSMVEMLGVLAIVGVLSVGGVYGYGVAMKKHKANELLHQASMLATTISSQIMTGKNPMLLDSFLADGKYGKFSSQVKDVNGNPITKDSKQFVLEITDVDSAVCEQLKNGGMVRDVKCEGTTAQLTFNRDLSAVDFVFDEDNLSDLLNDPGCGGYICQDNKVYGTGTGCDLNASSMYLGKCNGGCNSGYGGYLSDVCSDDIYYMCSTGGENDGMILRCTSSGCNVYATCYSGCGDYYSSGARMNDVCDEWGQGSTSDSSSDSTSGEVVYRCERVTDYQGSLYYNGKYIGYCQGEDACVSDVGSTLGDVCSSEVNRESGIDYYYCESEFLYRNYSYNEVTWCSCQGDGFYSNESDAINDLCNDSIDEDDDIWKKYEEGELPYCSGYKCENNRLYGAGGDCTGPDDPEGEKYVYLGTCTCVSDGARDNYLEGVCSSPYYSSSSSGGSVYCAGTGEVCNDYSCWSDWSAWDELCGSGSTGGLDYRYTCAGRDVYFYGNYIGYCNQDSCDGIAGSSVRDVCSTEIYPESGYEDYYCNSNVLWENQAMTASNGSCDCRWAEGYYLNESDARDDLCR